MKPFARILSLFLSLATALPSPAFALRAESSKEAGVEEQIRLAMADTTDPAGATARVITNRLATAFGLPPVSPVSQAAAGAEEKLRVNGAKATALADYLWKILETWSLPGREKNRDQVSQAAVQIATAAPYKNAEDFRNRLKGRVTHVNTEEIGNLSRALDFSAKRSQKWILTAAALLVGVTFLVYGATQNFWRGQQVVPLEPEVQAMVDDLAANPDRGGVIVRLQPHATESEAKEALGPILSATKVLGSNRILVVREGSPPNLEEIDQMFGKKLDREEFFPKAELSLRARTYYQENPLQPIPLQALFPQPEIRRKWEELYRVVSPLRKKSKELYVQEALKDPSDRSFEAVLVRGLDKPGISQVWEEPPLASIVFRELYEGAEAAATIALFEDGDEGRYFRSLQDHFDFIHWESTERDMALSALMRRWKEVYPKRLIFVVRGANHQAFPSLLQGMQIPHIISPSLKKEERALYSLTGDAPLARALAGRTGLLFNEEERTFFRKYAVAQRLSSLLEKGPNPDFSRMHLVLEEVMSGISDQEIRDLNRAVHQQGLKVRRLIGDLNPERFDYYDRLVFAWLNDRGRISDGFKNFVEPGIRDLTVKAWERSLPKAKAGAEELTPQRFASLFDHTNLDPAATEEKIRKTAAEAKERGFALVAVRPGDPVLWAADVLAGSNVKVGPAIGFRLLTSKYDGNPAGRAQALARYDISVEEKRQEIVRTLRLLHERYPNVGSEVDFVINLKRLIDGDETYVENEIRTLVQQVRALQRVDQEEHIVVKVIAEVAFLNNHQKRQVYRWAREHGADFVKTSTGYAQGGATKEDLALMHATVGGWTGIKAAGGIRTLKDALTMIRAAKPVQIEPRQIRLGTSASVAIHDAYFVQPPDVRILVAHPNSKKRGAVVRLLQALLAEKAKSNPAAGRVDPATQIVAVDNVDAGLARLETHSHQLVITAVNFPRHHRFEEGYSAASAGYHLMDYAYGNGMDAQVILDAGSNNPNALVFQGLRGEHAIAGVYNDDSSDVVRTEILGQALDLLISRLSAGAEETFAAWMGDNQILARLRDADVEVRWKALDDLKSGLKDHLPVGPEAFELTDQLTRMLDGGQYPQLGDLAVYLLIGLERFIGEEQAKRLEAAAQNRSLGLYIVTSSRNLAERFRLKPEQGASAGTEELPQVIERAVQFFGGDEIVGALEALVRDEVVPVATYFPTSTEVGELARANVEPFLVPSSLDALTMAPIPQSIKVFVQGDYKEQIRHQTRGPVVELVEEAAQADFVIGNAEFVAAHRVGQEALGKRFLQIDDPKLVWHVTPLLLVHIWNRTDLFPPGSILFVNLLVQGQLGDSLLIFA